MILVDQNIRKMHKTFFKIMVNLTNQELDDPFLWMGFNCFKAKEPLQGASLLFTT